MTDFAVARHHMVDGQVRTADVTDLRILSAMLEIPREKFVPPASAGLAYLDCDLPVDDKGARRLLKPMVLGEVDSRGRPRVQRSCSGCRVRYRIRRCAACPDRY